MSKRDDYFDTLKAQIDQWNADMAELEVKSHEALRMREAIDKASSHFRLK